MKEIYQKTLLYDYYGELLTERQREIYEEVVFNDMSLSEAASEYGVSRQGIHDMIRRCHKSMTEFEDKLHMVEQHEAIRKNAEKILKTVSRAEDGLGASKDAEHTEQVLEEIRGFADSILKTVQ